MWITHHVHWAPSKKHECHFGHAQRLCAHVVPVQADIAVEKGLGSCIPSCQVLDKGQEVGMWTLHADTFLVRGISFEDLSYYFSPCIANHC